MKSAILSLVLVGALAATADTRPPRYSGTSTVPARTSTFYDEARYGEFLPPSDPRSAFQTYGVPYARPYYRGASTAPVNPPTPTYTPRGGYIGMYNGGIFGSRR